MSGAQTTAARDAEPSQPAASAIDALVAHLQRLRYEDLAGCRRRPDLPAGRHRRRAVGLAPPRMAALKRRRRVSQGAEATVWASGEPLASAVMLNAYQVFNQELGLAYSHLSGTMQAHIEGSPAVACRSV